MRATERIYNNLYVTEMRYGKIDIPLLCTFSCFFIVENTSHTDYINQQIMDLLVASCRKFVFWGEYSASWKNTVDDLATKMLPTDDGIRVVESEYESNFVEELFEAISIKSFVPSIALLVYDDEMHYKSVLDQLFGLQQKGPLFQFVKNALNKMNPYDLLPDAPANEFYGEAEIIASKISTNDSVKQIANYIAEELSRSFGEIFTEDECMRAAESIQNLMKMSKSAEINFDLRKE